MLSSSSSIAMRATPCTRRWHPSGLGFAATRKACPGHPAARPLGDRTLRGGRRDLAHRPFLDFLGRVETYGEVAREVREVAAGMRLHGVGPGSRLGRAATQLAILRGRIPRRATLWCNRRPVSTLLAESELAVQLDVFRHRDPDHAGYRTVAWPLRGRAAGKPAAACGGVPTSHCLPFASGCSPRC